MREKALKFFDDGKQVLCPYCHKGNLYYKKRTKVYRCIKCKRLFKLLTEKEDREISKQRREEDEFKNMITIPCAYDGHLFSIHRLDARHRKYCGFEHMIMHRNDMGAIRRAERLREYEEYMKSTERGVSNEIQKNDKRLDTTVRKNGN